MQHVNPPPQLSEATFRTYEPFIHRAVNTWPDETRFTPDEMVNEKTKRPLSPNTFAARMRDAVVSLRRFGWETYIVREKFHAIFGSFAVSADADGSVWFRNRGRKGRPLVFAGETPSVAPSPTGMTHWPTWTIEEVAAACRLIHTGKLTSPITLAGLVTPDDSAQLMSTFNVGIFTDTTTNTTVIS